MHAVAEKPHDAIFDTYQNVQRHRAVLPAIARAFVLSYTNRVILQIRDGPKVPL